MVEVEQTAAISGCLILSDAGRWADRVLLLEHAPAISSAHLLLGGGQDRLPLEESAAQATPY